MQYLFKNIVIDLAATFTVKSFYTSDIILCSSEFDDFFTFLDKPFIHKSPSLSSLINDLYGGNWSVFFKDLCNIKTPLEGRSLSVFLNSDDYVDFLGKFVSSVFPNMELDHKVLVIKAVCDDTRYIKSLMYDGEKRKTYLEFKPSLEKIKESANQCPVDLPQGLADELYFDFIIGHHLCEPRRFFDRIFRSFKSIAYQEFRLNFMQGCVQLRSIFSFDPENSIEDNMSQDFLKFSFDNFEVNSFYTDPDGSDVKLFLEKYGVEWINKINPYKNDLRLILEEKYPDYARNFKSYMLDDSYLLDLCDKPEKIKEMLKRMSLEPEFGKIFKFPLLAEWFRLHEKGVQIKIVD